MKKGYKIDAEKRTITEVEVGDYKTIYPHLSTSIKAVDCFTVVGIEKDDSIYVDDEGLLTIQFDTPFFLYEGYPQPLAGNGLVLGTDEEGESVDPKNTLEFIKSKVKFMNLIQAQAWARENQ